MEWNVKGQNYKAFKVKTFHCEDIAILNCRQVKKSCDNKDKLL